MSVKNNEQLLRNHLQWFHNYRTNWLAFEPKETISQSIDKYIADQLQMEAVYDDLAKYENDMWNRNQWVLRAIKKVRGRTFYKHLMNYIQDCEGCKSEI